MIRRNKMIETNLRTFNIKVLVFIFIKPPLYERLGRHSTTDIPIEIIASKSIEYQQKIVTINCEYMGAYLCYKKK